MSSCRLTIAWARIMAAPSNPIRGALRFGDVMHKLKFTYYIQVGN